MTGIIRTVLPFLQWEPGTIPGFQLLVSVTCWLLLYHFSRQVLYDYTAEYCCRLNTLLHGIFVTTISAFLHFYHGPAPWNNFGNENMPLHNLILLLSLGYFIFDFTWCCAAGSEEAAMLAHHVVSLVGLSYSVYYHRYGAEVTAVCFGAEITNPMLQFRWFLREHGQYHTTIGVVNDYLFVFSFAFWRFGLGSYLFYRAIITDKVDLVIKAGATALYVISAVFMFHVGRFFVRKYIWKMKKPPRKEE